MKKNGEMGEIRKERPNVIEGGGATAFLFFGEGGSVKACLVCVLFEGLCNL